VLSDANAFIQVLIPEIQVGEEPVMKNVEVLVDMLVELNPELHGPYVVYEKTRKVLYVQVLRAIYGILEAALYYGTRSSDMSWSNKDLNLIHTTHVLQIITGKDHNIRSFSMWMI
jgi:hypothetical protein